MPEARKFVYRLGGALAVLALLAACAWLALPYIVRTMIHSLAERNGLQSVVIDIESVRWDHTVIRRLAFKTETQYGPVVVDLERLTARYQPTVMALTAVAAESGTVRWRQVSVTTPAAADAAIPGLPPLPPMRIERMEISLDSQWGHSRFSGELDLASVADKIIVRLSDQRQSLQLTTDPEFLTAAVTLTSHGASIAALKATYPFTMKTILDGSAQLHQLQKWSQGNQLVPTDITTTLQQLSMDHGLLSLQGQLIQDAGQYEFEGQGQSTWRGWQQPGMVLDGHIDFRVNVKNDQWRLTALPHSRLSLADVHWGDENASIAIPKAEFDVEAEIRIHGETDGRMIIDSFAASTSALEIFLDPDTPVRTQRLQLTGKVVPSGDHNRVELRALASQPLLPALNITAESLRADAVFDTDRQLRAKGTFSAAGVRLQDWPKVMSALSLSGQFDHHDREITALGDAQIGKRKIAKWRLQPRTPTVTTLKATAEFDVTTLWPFVKPLFDNSWKGLAFASGALSGEAQLVWNGSTTSTMTLRGAGINGRYEAMDFTDLAIELSSQDVLSADYNMQINVEHAKVAGDIPVSDVGIDFHWRGNTVELTAARLQAFGGELAVQPTAVTLGSGEQRLAVNVAGLDFGQVLAMLDQRGLSGSGRLAGTIPISFVGDGIEIKDAELRSTASGTLRYRAGENAAAPIDNIALQALQDFHYDSMRIWINYEPDGAYRIRLRLEGRNPGLYNGYPIAFNLNLSGELPDLLRAGILTGDFSKQILRDVQSGR